MSGPVEYETCGICREQMTEAKKLSCSHMFHLRCLMGWMRYKQTCPICRRSLREGAEQDGHGGNPGHGNPNGNPGNGGNPGNPGNGGEVNNADLIPWWLRMFGSFIQIHNVDIIEARGLNDRRRGNMGRRRNVHRPQPDINTEQQISRISEILGGRVSDQEIRTRLLRTHSMERTIEFFLANPR